MAEQTTSNTDRDASLDASMREEAEHGEQSNAPLPDADDATAKEALAEQAPDAAGGCDCDAAEKLAVKEREFEDLANQYVRLRADFDNYRRRTRQEMEAMAGRAAERLITNLLPVLDNLDRALDSVKMSAGAESFYAGVDMVRRGLMDVLAAEGLEETPGVGADFDPNHHEAVDRSGDDACCVVEVYRKGYKLAGRVLRPAMVKVGPAPAADTQQQTADAQQQ